jgi:GMP synthase (glutamine-hydrolysing)
MILIINCGSIKTSKIGEVVDALNYKSTTIFVDDFNAKIHLKELSGIIISGAPILVTEINQQPFLDKFGFLLTTELPVLGICFGHQILGLVYGANASKCKEDRDWQTISVTKDSYILKNMNDNFKMKQDHCEQISVPNGFVLLASSTICKNEVMQHKTKPLYGVQFHPEVSGEKGVQLIRNFLRNINA